MRFTFLKRRPVATERLLALRAEAGDDPVLHARYHRTVNRYQRVILKAYYLRKRFPLLSWLWN